MSGNLVMKILEEEFKLKRLREIVDRTAARLRWETLTEQEAEDLIAKTRRQVLELFPDKGYLFDWIYRSRYARIRDERPGGKPIPKTA